LSSLTFPRYAKLVSIKRELTIFAGRLFLLNFITTPESISNINETRNFKKENQIPGSTQYTKHINLPYLMWAMGVTGTKRFISESYNYLQDPFWFEVMQDRLYAKLCVAGSKNFNGSFRKVHSCERIIGWLILTWVSVTCFHLASYSCIVLVDIFKIRSACFQYLFSIEKNLL